ncbi:MAG: FecR domain-containing protein [Opitutae bacterium]|nr:FecR domain-containing protein [Opitutae bacterium]
MNPSPRKYSAAAEDQAALWAARLDGSTLTAADRAALDQWLNEDPAHRALLSQYCQFSTDLEDQLPALVAAGAVHLPPEKKPARFRWPVIWSAGVALAAAAAVAFALWTGAPASQIENLSTPLAQRQSFTLTDGTQVELNAQTSLRVENTKSERRVRLAGGEAFFRVSKDSARPFIVETPAGSVRVTGTVFDVRTESASEFDVTVVEGSVQVRPGALGRDSAPVALGARERFSASAGTGVQTLSTAALDDVLAWRQGQIVFDRVPLHEALARFARYHGRGLTATAGAAQLRVGGRFSLDDLDGFCTALEEVLPVRVSRDLSGTVQVSLRADH